MYVHPKTRLIKKRILARTLASIEEKKLDSTRIGWGWGKPRIEPNYEKIWVQLRAEEKIPGHLFKSYFGLESSGYYLWQLNSSAEERLSNNYVKEKHGYWKYVKVGEVVHPFDEANAFRNEYNYHKNYVRYPKYYSKWDYRDMREMKRRLIKEAEHRFALEDYYGLPE